MSEKDESRAKDQARMQLDGIVAMVKRLEHSDECKGDEDCELTDEEIIEGAGTYYKEGAKATDEEREEYHDRNKAIDAVSEDPLSVQVRSDWHDPSTKGESFEYVILLCTGGPAVRIVGELDEHQQPDSAKIQYQDWGTPWLDYFPLKDGEREFLLNYARQLYFGE